MTSSRLLIAVLCIMQWAFTDATMAQPAGDRSGALVVFPFVLSLSGPALETRVFLANAGTSSVSLHCFFENLVGSCEIDPEQACAADSECSGGRCIQGYAESNFEVLYFPAGQVLAWAVASGLPGVAPPVSEFIGMLRCVAVGPDLQTPVAAQLEGRTEIYNSNAPAGPGIASYNAYTFARNGGNGDSVLEIGSEYSACPASNVLQHSFQGASDPVSSASLSTTLVLATCSADYELQTPIETLVHFTVINEFAQRTGTSKRFSSQLVADLSSIHPTLFQASTQGSLAGQTLIRSVNDPVLGIAIEVAQTANGFSVAAHELPYLGTSIQPNVAVVLPPAN